MVHARAAAVGADNQEEDYSSSEIFNLCAVKGFLVC